MSSQARGAGNPTSVVFVTPAITADVRFQVFKRQFQVNSMILKTHSTFFGKFLNSPDKTPSSGMTKVDNDGGWALTCRAKEVRSECPFLFCTFQPLHHRQSQKLSRIAGAENFLVVVTFDPLLPHNLLHIGDDSHA